MWSRDTLYYWTVLLPCTAWGFKLSSQSLLKEKQFVFTHWYVPLSTRTSMVTRWPYTCHWGLRLFLKLKCWCWLPTIYWILPMEHLLLYLLRTWSWVCTILLRCARVPQKNLSLVKALCSTLLRRWISLITSVRYIWMLLSRCVLRT